MIAYACVYRRYRPTPTERARTESIAASNPILGCFLKRYDQSFLDWGDDPAFFAAEQILGDVRRASWGVCRPDVRGVLGENSFVVFFAGLPLDDRWEYYWVGLGTVKRLVRDRRDIWAEHQLAAYGRFFNVLVAPDGRHREYFRPEHDDWETKRIRSPYILFDENVSRFDLRTPLHVSTYRREEGVPDRWRSQDATVERLESLLFRNRTDRRLRTSEFGYGHAKLRLPGTDVELSKLRSELLKLFASRVTTLLPVAAPESKEGVPSRGGGCG
jgi:hypothetical protein